MIGEEVEQLVPDAVHGRRAFAGAQKARVRRDVAIVDDPVLFMHGVGAVQQHEAGAFARYY